VSKSELSFRDVGGILLVSASLHRMSQHFFRVARNPSGIDASADITSYKPTYQDVKETYSFA